MWGRLLDVKKLLVDGFTTKIACPTRSFCVLVYPSGVDLSSSALRYLAVNWPRTAAIRARDGAG